MKTIRGRLLALLLGGIVAVLAAGGASVYWIARASLVREMDAGLGARAHVLASLVSNRDGSILLDLEEAPATTVRDCYYEFRDADDGVLHRSFNLRGSSLPGAGPGDDVLVLGDVDLPGGARGRAAWLAFKPHTDDEDEANVETVGLDDGTTTDDGHDDEPVLATGYDGRAPLMLIAAVDRAPIDRALSSLLTALLIVGGLVGGTVTLLVTSGVRWGLEPLDQLTRKLGDVGEGTMSRRFDDAGVPRELEPIYRELNRMLDRVERVLERERSFADAAAHELRTPLAELRTTAEVAAKWPDADRAESALAEVLVIGREMERLVESLLLISRGQASAVNGADGRTAVGSIVRACVRRDAEAIAERRLDVTVELDDRTTLAGSHDAVEVIVRNLVGNAIQYTPTDGSIRIHGDGASGGAALVVDNGPVTMTQEDLPRLFEPFWRADASRSGRDHCGLGLSVVQQIAAAIGARVDAELSGDRLRIRVSPVG